MNKETVIALAQEAHGAMLASGRGMYLWHGDALAGDVQDFCERFAALVVANNPPQSWMSYQEGYEAGKQAESARRLQQEAWNIDTQYASVLALMLECMILDPRRWHDDAVKVLDQYRAEWDKLNPSPSPFGKD